jgi:hypothetical protein
MQLKNTGDSKMSETKVGETKLTESKPKKMVRRSVAITLAIACIVLIAGLGVTIDYYTMTISDKDRTITSLTDIINLANFTVLASNQTITQTAGNYTSWKFIANVTGYVCVYVLSSTTNNTYVRVIYNASIPTFSEINGVSTNFKWVIKYEGGTYHYQYDNQVNVGRGSENIFFVPCSEQPFSSTSTKVEIRVGNTNAVDNATETVMITYYY